MTHDPVRWLDSPEAPLSPEVRRALSALAVRAPSAQQRANMIARIEALEALPALCPSGARSLLRWALGVAGLLLLGALLLPQLAERTQEPVRRAEQVERPAPESVAAPSPASKGDDARAVDAEQERPRADERVSARTAKHARGLRPVRVSVAEPESSPSDPTVELALLVPARRLLTTDPARTLALSEQHMQRFPRGVFAEERAFLRLEALLRLGRRTAAESEARAFRSAYPSSTYLERLHALLSP